MLPPPISLNQYSMVRPAIWLHERLASCLPDAGSPLAVLLEAIELKHWVLLLLTPGGAEGRLLGLTA